MTSIDILQRERQLREETEQARQAEMDRRTRAHQQNVARFKKHREIPQLASSDPLNLHAIGDSWFDYPLDGNGPSIYNNAIVGEWQLGAKGNPNPNILNRAWYGQASTVVMTWENQRQMIWDWTTADNWINSQDPAEAKPDAILASMGGDDLAGDQFAIYLTYGGGQTTASPRLQGVLDLIAASYSDLFALRDLFAPGTPVFGHCYDYALPNGIPAAGLFGPWLRPSFDFAHYKNFQDAEQVVADMINKFQAMLNGLASDATNNFHLIDTRNTIAANNDSPDGWANELHPYTPGFGRLADKYVTALRTYFPGRI
jgi:hypothetical protein